jgi:phage terminase large subunit
VKQPSTYYHVKKSKAKIQVHQGGTRSGKTYSICQALIELCFKNKGAGIVITIVRKTFPALRSSVMRDFFDILTEGENYYEENHNKSQATYTLFGNLVEFISADQPQKLRGRKRTMLYINEANELSLEDWRQLILRTTDKTIIDYNPSDQYHWIYEYVLNRDDVDFFQTTYLDNPFLEQSVIDEIERFKETDENYWRIYGLGERGVNTAAVFPQWQVADAIPGRAKLVAYGMDWGFTNDPTALVSVWREDYSLYIKEHLYKTGLTNRDISLELDKLELDRTPIICDSAEPKSIEELHRLGHNVKPSKKGPDSIRLGIDIMKRHKLYILKESLNAQKEFRNYRWETNKDGVQLSKPVDHNNHIVDAVRYVCINRIGTPYSGKYFIS